MPKKINDLNQEDIDLISSKKNKLTNKKTIIITTFIIIILLMSVSIVNLKYFDGKLLKSLNNKITDTSKIELNYTKTSDNAISGIYMTDVSEVVENTMPAIVAITSKTLISSGNFGPFFNWNNQQQYSEGAGSGIIISKSDTKLFILTNNHVIEDSSELTVQFINGKTADATVVGTSERKDLAVISVNLDSLDKETVEEIKIATIGSSDELKVGNGIIAIGNALGYGQSVTTGVVSALNREVSIDGYTNKMIQIDAAINGGNSGGALLNSKGEVVGINSAKYSSNAMSSSASIEGMGFAIPISDVDELITTLMNGQEDNSGVTLGVEGFMTNSNNIRGYNLPVGFYISSIVSGSNAAKANLEIGDIITKIDGKEIDDFNDLSNALYEKKKNDTAVLTVKYSSGSEYKEKEVTVKFSE